MRTLALLALMAVLSSGCVQVNRPMAAEEFKGFCYQWSGSRQASCDTISVCDAYDPVVNARQPSLDKCLEECQNIYGPQRQQYMMRDCEGAAQNARDWCQRFCRDNYPK